MENTHIHLTQINNIHVLSRLNGSVTFKTSPYVQWGDVYILGTEHNRKLKFSMQTHPTHINTILYFNITMLQ